MPNQIQGFRWLEGSSTHTHMQLHPGQHWPSIYVLLDYISSTRLTAGLGWWLNTHCIHSWMLAMYMYMLNPQLQLPWMQTYSSERIVSTTSHLMHSRELTGQLQGMHWRSGTPLLSGHFGCMDAWMMAPCDASMSGAQGYHVSPDVSVSACVNCVNRRLKRMLHMLHPCMAMALAVRIRSEHALVLRCGMVCPTRVTYMHAAQMFRR